MKETRDTVIASKFALYGPLKALSEKEVEKWFPGNHCIIRPGLIVGPGDETDRFTYWPVRIDRGGEVLAPGNPSDPVQFIDARDLAEWTIRMAGARGNRHLQCDRAGHCPNDRRHAGRDQNRARIQTRHSPGCQRIFWKRKRCRPGQTCRSGSRRRAKMAASAK